MWFLLTAAALSILGGLGVKAAADSTEKGRVWKGLLGFAALWGAGAIGVYLSSKYAAGLVITWWGARALRMAKTLATLANPWVSVFF